MKDPTCGCLDSTLSEEEEPTSPMAKVVVDDKQLEVILESTQEDAISPKTAEPETPAAQVEEEPKQKEEDDTLFDDLETPKAAKARVEDEGEEEEAAEAETAEVEAEPEGQAGPELHMELDFDVNPSELYLLLQRRDWKTAEARLAEHPEEATYWVSRKELDGTLRWRLLPIHGAIIFNATPSMVEALLESYPVAISCKDDQGMLPLHLSYRMGSSAEVIQVLLHAFPESVEVMDRKGRTPLVMAQTSKGPNRDVFLQVVEKHIADLAADAEAKRAKEAEEAAAEAEATALVDNKSPVCSPRDVMVVEPMVDEEPLDEATVAHRAQLQILRDEHEQELESFKKESTARHLEMEKQVIRLTADLSKSEQRAQALVEHVATLESKLKMEEETETALATKIASLDSTYKSTLREKELVENNLKSATESLTTRNAELQTKLEALQEANKTIEVSVTEAVVSKEKNFKLLEMKHAKLAEKHAALQDDFEGARSTVTILEEQLKMKVSHEQKLVHQIASLAAQLSEATSDNDHTSGLFSGRVKTLESERNDLRSTVSMLSKKLYNIADVLREMESAQAGILAKAEEHQAEMNAAAREHALIVARLQSQQKAFEEAKQERSRMAQLLHEQESLLQKSDEARERVVTSVEEHSKQVTHCERLRVELVQEATSLKARIGSVLDEVTSDLPEATSLLHGEHLVQEIVKSMMSSHISEASTSSDIEEEKKEEEMPATVEL